MRLWSLLVSLPHCYIATQHRHSTLPCTLQLYMGTVRCHSALLFCIVTLFCHDSVDLHFCFHLTSGLLLRMLPLSRQQCPKCHSVTVQPCLTSWKCDLVAFTCLALTKEDQPSVPSMSSVFSCHGFISLKNNCVLDTNIFNRKHTSNQSPLNMHTPVYHSYPKIKFFSGGPENIGKCMQTGRFSSHLKTRTESN